MSSVIQRKIVKRAAAALVLVCGLALLAEKKPADAKDPDVAVIVNPLNPVENISSADLRKIYSGEKQSWNSNLPIFVLVRAPHAREREVLLGRVLRMTDSEYKQHWIRKVYSGEAAREPLALLSNGMQLEAVRAERGAIALISVQDVHSGVKVLKVDGRLPGAPGYSLK